MNEANNQTQLQIAQENREDGQQNEKDNIILDGQVKMEIDNNQARNKMYENQAKDQNNFLNNKP
jgi:hypothetical protein